MSHYSCLKCEKTLEKISPVDFCRSTDESQYFDDICNKYGIDKSGPFSTCKDCNFVYPYPYHSSTGISEEEPFSCALCGYVLEILGTADEHPVTNKIFYCPDCIRKGLSDSYFGFVDDECTSNKYFMPLSRKQVIERFEFLESGSHSEVDLAYYSEAFAQDPDYVINRLGNQDCVNFIHILKYAYSYEPEPESIIEDAESIIDLVDDPEDNNIAVPTCPNHNIYEEFVIESNCLYLKTKIDKRKNVKNISTSAFFFVISLIFMYSMKGKDIAGSAIMNEVIFDLGAMCAFITLSILVMSIVVNYFNLFYYMELTCESGVLSVDINDKVQSDHWQFSDAKSISLAQYSKKKGTTITVDLDAPISTSKKSKSGVKTIGLYIYQHKKRYLIRLPFSHLQIKWLGIAIREVCKAQGIIKAKSAGSLLSGLAAATDIPLENDTIPRSATTPKEDAISQLSKIVGPKITTNKKV